MQPLVPLDRPVLGRLIILATTSPCSHSAISLLSLSTFNHPTVDPFPTIANSTTDKPSLSSISRSTLPQAPLTTQTPPLLADSPPSKIVSLQLLFQFPPTGHVRIPRDSLISVFPLATGHVIYCTSQNPSRPVPTHESTSITFLDPTLDLSTNTPFFSRLLLQDACHTKDGHHGRPPPSIGTQITRLTNKIYCPRPFSSLCSSEMWVIWWRFHGGDVDLLEPPRPASAAATRAFEPLAVAVDASRRLARVTAKP